MVIAFFRLIRYTNLLIIALLMFLIRYFVFEKGVHSTGILFQLQFPLLNFILLTLSVLLIAAGGNVINDIYDQEIDAVNKPQKRIINVHISETKAWILYFILTFLGVAIGYYLAQTLHNTSFILFHLISPALLWVYASQLKKSALLGNIVIALLAACVPLIQLTFEYGALLGEYWMILENNVLGNPLQSLFDQSIYLSIFAFLSTIIREIIKDVEDIEGDSIFGARTIPVKIGIEKTKTVILVLCVCTMVLLLASPFYFSSFKQHATSLLTYQLVLIVPLFVYALVKLKRAKNKIDYTHLSALLKLIMLVGFAMVIL